jgi:outer membrane murein-binding lipoprotein Lpp
VESLERVMIIIGEPITGTQGNRLYGGHSMRVAGARYLAAIGIDLLTIQLMGRWGSEIVLRYVADVPLSALSRRVIDIFNTAEVDSVVQHLEERPAPATPIVGVSSDNDARIDDIASDVGTLFTQLGATTESIRLLSEQVDLARKRAATAARGAPQVFNCSSGVVHVSLGRIGHPTTWRTRCGWAFGTCSNAVETDDIESGMKRCASCWRDLFAGTLPESDGSEC